MASSDAPATDTADDTLGIAYHDLQAANQKVEEATRELNRLKLLKIQYLQTRYPSADFEKMEKRCRQRTPRPMDMSEVVNSEWWTQTKEAGLDTSIVRLNEQIQQAEVDKAELEALQAEIRRRIADMTRDKVRTLNVFDLPDELLVAICGHVEDADLPCSVHHDWGNRKDIRNVRLVCRRFNYAASGFLVRRICVEPNQASLARLDEISRHPAIAAGVHHVKLVLRFFNPELAYVKKFVMYHTLVLDEQIDRYGQDVEWQGEVNQADEFSRKLRQLGQAWDYKNEPYDSDPAMQRLLRAHSKYRDLVEEQQSFLSESRFAQAAGLAMARMPKARYLEIMDTDPREVPLLGPDVGCFGNLEPAMWRAMEECMRQPMGGHGAVVCEQSDYIEGPSYDCVFDFLDGVRRGGAWLETMGINLRTLGYPGSMVPTLDTRRELVSGLQKLREFSFTILDGTLDEDEDWITRKSGVEAVEKFAGACIDTPSLETLKIEIGWASTRLNVDMGKVVGLIDRPLLKSLSLRRVYVGPEDFKVFLDHLTHASVSLSFADLLLLGGTWDELLDVLRNKEAGEKWLRMNGHEWLKRAPEQEISDMSADEYSSIFEGEGGGGIAQLYISKKLSGEFAPNPFRALKERRAAAAAAAAAAVAV